MVCCRTAAVVVKNPKDSKELKIKVLFDNGSQRSYISNRVANFLNLPSESVENIFISTFGNNQPSNQKANVVTVQLKSNVEESIDLKVLSVPFICMPFKNQPIKITQRDSGNLREIDFADTGVHYDIDLLIGSDCYWKLFTGKTLKGKNNTVIASGSKFGWVLNGTVEKKTKEGENFTFANNIVHVCHIQVHLLNKLDLQMKRFWELESIGILNKEKQPYNYFEKNICKNQENRYEVKLPFKENHPLIHDNFQMCKERLLKLRKKLKNDSEILSQYNEIFEEQRHLGITETVSEPGKKGETHYLAHHPVIREDKDTTKLRIVFDASAKTFGPSLNECLYKGPQLTPLVFNIWLRFRAQVIAQEIT